MLASSESTPVAAFASDERRMYGVQWHPEVRHTAHGQQVIESFLHDAAGIAADWNPGNVIAEQVERIRAQVGDARVICGLSGGVDSAVAAALVQRAVGDQLTCVFVDHGLLREGEAEQVEHDYVAATGVNLVVVDAADTFLDALDGVSDPETKRKIIGREFIRAFERAAADVVAQAAEDGGGRPASWCRARSTPTSSSPAAAAGPRTSRATTTSAACRRTSSSHSWSRCAPCSRTRCARSAASSGCPRSSSAGSRSPARGSAIRIVGAVTRDRLATLRRADAIVREELSAAGLDGEIWQCPVVLLADVRSVGVQGDGRTYGHPIVLRPVSSEDAMTADWTRLPYDLLAKVSNRITNEVAEVNRVVLDVTSKPPGTIEWE